MQEILPSQARYFYLAAESRQTKRNIMKILQTGLFIVLVKWVSLANEQTIRYKSAIITKTPLLPVRRG